MESCEACGAALTGVETRCSSCGLVFEADEPPPTFALTNPIDGSLIYPSSGPPIETDLDPESTLGDDEILQPVTNRDARKWWIPPLVPALGLVLTFVGSAYWIASGPMDEMDVIVADLASYSSRSPAIETTRRLAPRTWLEQYRVEFPAAYERAKAQHRPLDTDTKGDPHSLTAVFLERVVEFDPDFAAALGSHPHPLGITAIDVDYSCRWLFLAADLLDALQVWTQSRQLTPHERTDAELLRLQLARLGGMELEQGDAWLLQRIESSFDSLPLLALFRCCPGEERMMAAVNRLRDIEARLAEVPALLINPPEAIVLSAVRQVSAIRTYVGEYPDLWNYPRQAIVEQCDSMIHALEAYERALTTEVYPRSKGVLGVGPNEYAAILAQQGLSPELVPKLARDAATEYATLRKEFAQARRELEHESRSVQVSPRWDTDEDAFGAIQLFRSHLNDWIVQGPRNDPGVSMEPAPSMWTSFGGGFYLPPGLSAPRLAHMLPRFLTVNSANYEEGLHPLTTEHIAAHEVYPGHHLHFQMARESSCDVRLIFDVGISLEGWAVYATDLAHEVGNHDQIRILDDYFRIFERMCFAFDASFEALLHTRSASTDELLELLKLHYRNDELTLADVGDRARHPGQLSKYFAGYRAIRQLRDAVSEQQGADFDRRVFHERLLRAGFVPPALLEVEFLSEPAAR